MVIVRRERILGHTLTYGLGLVMLVLAISSGKVQAQANIRFAPEKDYGPFVFESDRGQIMGLSIDILNAIKPMMDVTITPLPPQPLSQILKAAQDGQVDLISSLRPTPERSQYLAFTAPYVLVPTVLVVRQGSTQIRIQDLSGQPVAVGQGYAVEKFVRETYPNVQWQTVPDDLTGLRGLLQGRYRGVIADIASVSHAVRMHDIRGVQVAESIGFEYPLSFAYRKELTHLGQQLDGALKRLDSPTRQTITNRWIDAHALHFENPKRSMLRWVGAVLAAIAAVTVTWSFVSRKRTSAGSTDT